MAVPPISVFDDVTDEGEKPLMGCFMKLYAFFIQIICVPPSLSLNQNQYVAETYMQSSHPR